MSWSAFRTAWLAWIQQLYTGYFACVMATGIVSIALLLNHTPFLSDALWAIGGALLLFLLAIYLLRWVRYPRDVQRDATDPTRLFGYFTLVAGCGVLATRAALSSWVAVPVILTAIAVILWLLFLYWAFAILLFTNERPIEQSVNGAWLIAIVATESLAITWVLLAHVHAGLIPALQFLSYAFWTFGVLLYLIFITFIAYRFFFSRVRPTDLTPPYWINMGAMAITTVAGVRLLQTPQPSAFLASLRPYIAGFTIMMWAWGTWWIPLLVMIGIWKYGVRRQPLRYEPALWSIVFPLGMYATALHLLSQLPGIEFFSVVAPTFTWIAFAAWLLVLAGWLYSVLRAIARLRMRDGSQQPSVVLTGSEERLNQGTWQAPSDEGPEPPPQEELRRISDR